MTLRKDCRSHQQSPRLCSSRFGAREGTQTDGGYAAIGAYRFCLEPESLVSGQEGSLSSGRSIKLLPPPLLRQRRFYVSSDTVFKYSFGPPERFRPRRGLE